jgi:hypothetical protein
LDGLRSSAVDVTSLLKTFVEQRGYLKIPLRKGPTRGVHEAIAHVYAYAASHPVDRSVTKTVLDCFGGPASADVLPFVAQIARHSRSDAAVNLFRQFIVGDLPLHMFLFFAEISVKAGAIEMYEHRQRTNCLAARFAHCGWGNVPRNRKQSCEGVYCTDPEKFPVFCLGLYQFCIWQLEATMADIKAGDIEDAVKNVLSLSGPELFEAEEFMKQIAPEGRVTLTELAVLLFRKNVEFEGILVSFDPARSPVLLEYENFGVKGYGSRAGKKALVVTKVPKGTGDAE